MKKTLLLIISLLTVCFGKAQLVVDANGNVGVGIDAEYLQSTLAVGYLGNPLARVSSQKDYAYAFLSRTTENFGYAYGIFGKVEHPSNTIMQSFKGFGLFGYGVNTTNSSNRRTYGVFGIAGKGESAYNYGVYGCLVGNSDGAGIVGTVTNQDYQDDIQIHGKYAGYFAGNVKITGTTTALSFTNTSDLRLKKNISSIGKERSLNGLLKLKPVEYEMKELKEISIVNVPDTLSANSASHNEEEYSSRTYFGLIAQEVKALLSG